MNITNSELLAKIRHNNDNLEEQLELPHRTERQPLTLIQGSNWENDTFPTPVLIDNGIIYPDDFLPNAKALEIKLRTVPRIILTEKYNITSNIENFCYLYLLLSGSWRSDDELKSGQSSWIKALEYHGLSVPDNDSVFAYYKLLISYMLDSPRYSHHDIVRTISMMNYDMTEYLHQIMANSSDVQKKKIAEIIKEIITLKSIEDRIEDIGNAPSEEQLNHFIVYKKTDQEREDAHHKYVADVTKLNSEQKYIHDEIVQRIDANQQVTAFVQGKAGTGKSFLIHTLINYLISKSIPFVVCASTGIAASLIGGNTVHSTFGLFTKKTKSNETVLCSLDVTRPNDFAMTYVKVIIIDEVTMISGDVLDAMEWGLRKIMSQIESVDREKMFGGKSLLLFGDLAQVPAVSINSDDLNESLHQFHESISYSGFIKWELKQLMRQNPNEKIFIELLDNIRNHVNNEKLNDNVLEELKKIFIPGLLEDVVDDIDDFIGHDNPNGMVITFTNSTAQIYNQYIVNKRIKINGCRKVQLSAKFYVRTKTNFIANPGDDYSTSINRQNSITEMQIASQSDIKILCAAMNKHQINSIIPFSVTIIPGARIMLLQNLDVKHGLINGARGSIVDYIEDIDSLSIKFDFQNEMEEPILIPRKKSLEYQINEGKQIFMYQFPIKLAWAITAHKSQGQTLEKAAIHIGENAFAHGALYVAFSRVRSLENIRLFGLKDWPRDGPAFHVNPYIQAKQNSQAENEFI